MAKEAKFVLIKGGKVTRSSGKGGGGGRGGGGGSSPSPQPPRRPHWLADLYFAAISRTHEEQWGGERAHGIREIAARMTLLSSTYLGRYFVVDEGMVTRVRNVVNSNALAYGWTSPDVQKGSRGEDRGYFPILVDTDSDDNLIQYLDADDHDYAKYGAISFANTLMSMAQNQCVSMNLLSVSDITFRNVTNACSTLTTALHDLVAEALAIP